MQEVAMETLENGARVFLDSHDAGYPEGTVIRTFPSGEVEVRWDDGEETVQDTENLWQCA